MEGIKFLRRTFEKSKYSIYNSRNLILNANMEVIAMEVAIYNSRNLILNANTNIFRTCAKSTTVEI